MEIYAHMYTRKLRTIKATEKRIELKTNTTTIHQVIYRAVPKYRKVLEQHIQTKLEADVVEPKQTEWAVQALQEPKK